MYWDYLAERSLITGLPGSNSNREEGKGGKEGWLCTVNHVAGRSGPNKGRCLKKGREMGRSSKPYPALGRIEATSSTQAAYKATIESKKNGGCREMIKRGERGSNLLEA